MWVEKCYKVNLHGFSKTRKFVNFLVLFINLSFTLLKTTAD